MFQINKFNKIKFINNNNSINNNLNKIYLFIISILIFLLILFGLIDQHYDFFFYFQNIDLISIKLFLIKLKIFTIQTINLIKNK